MVKLVLNSEYTREDIHSVFSPYTKYIPQRGTWGLHGIVSIPDRNDDFVFIVTYGQKQGAHTFDEGITDQGVLSWQSQPSNKLTDNRIQKLINHNEIHNNIYLFLRDKKGVPYKYYGRLKYLSHDNESEEPVYFKWQLLDWHLVHENLEVVSDSKGQDLYTAGSLLFSQNKPTKKSKGGDTVQEFNSKRSPDYAARDQANKALGDLGEELVLKHEIQNLIEKGRKDLSDRVLHTSQIEGDGAGYDIHSFDENGSTKYIEVKTTRGNIDTDFYMSPREVKFSQLNKDNYYLYRVYDLDKESNGKYFIIQGDIMEEFEIIPTGFRLSKK